MDTLAAKKRCEAATPEPWETHQEGDGFNSVRICKPISDGECQPVGEAEILGTIRAQAEANADFIAHARSDLPAALEALEEAQGRIAELENALRAAQTYVKAVRPTVGESE